MLSDRTYLLGPSRRPSTSVLVWLLSALIAGFVLQLFFHFILGPRAGAAFDRLLVLSPESLQAGRLWTVLTYSFLHDTGGFILLHLLLNTLWLWLLGKELLTLLGSGRFLSLWFGGIALGGVTWVGMHWRDGGQIIGASAGVMALLMTFTCIHPNHRFRILVFFIPVTFVAKYLMLALAVLDLAGFVAFEVLGKTSPLAWAHSAHLGGMAAGWIYFRWVHLREWRTPDRPTELGFPHWLRRKPAPPPPAAAAVSVPEVTAEVFRTPGELKVEVDRILDKINADGFAALSPAERQVLDRARSQLGKSV
jgi:membrane associated rhomboid family serine protease